MLLRFLPILLKYLTLTEKCSLVSLLKLLEICETHLIFLVSVNFILLLDLNKPKREV